VCGQGQVIGERAKSGGLRADDRGQISEVRGGRAEDRRLKAGIRDRKW